LAHRRSIASAATISSLNKRPDDLELEPWLEDNERALPRRFVVTYRSPPLRPVFIAELSGWNFAIQAPDGDFVFEPPGGGTRVELAVREVPVPL
jgi:hypothetical protein